MLAHTHIVYSWSIPHNIVSVDTMCTNLGYESLHLLSETLNLYMIYSQLWYTRACNHYNPRYANVVPSSISDMLNTNGYSLQSLVSLYNSRLFAGSRSNGS